MLALVSDWLDPRRSLAARLVWVVVLLSVVLSLVIGLILGSAAESEAEHEIGSLHAEYARQLADQLDDNTNTRLKNVQIIAGLIDSRRANPDDQRALLSQMQAAYPEYAWIGLADLHGTLIAATGHLLEGQDVSTQAWYIHGKAATFVVDMHQTELLDKLLPVSSDGESLRFIDVTAPVKNAQGQVVGVLGALLNWSWVRSVEKNTLAPLRLSRNVEAMIISADGHVLLGPSSLAGSQLDASLFNSSQIPAQNYQNEAWPDGIDYLSGFARGDGQGDFKGLGWTMLVRERATDAFAQASQTRQRLLLFGFGVGLLFAALGVWLMRRITRPLDQIAAAAERIQHDQDAEIPLFKGMDEVARVAHSLNSLVNSLAARNHELQGLNTSLEDRVMERTREIERLSVENQQSAITRERLRMARDLHDTLAHTLAGLLTQIRLTRKVAIRNPQAVADELAQAELAAQHGLQEARTAITSLRVNPVRELGLAMAMEQRLSAFAQQKNIQVEYRPESALSALVDDRAETLYRIFEEVLRNIEKHAQASHISVSLQKHTEGHKVIMTVCDDGVGFDPDAPMDGHFGLHGMREQCELIGATLAVTSTLGTGTCVIVAMSS